MASTKYPVVDGKKICCKCFEVKPVEEFRTFQRSDRKSPQMMATCRNCSTKRTRKAFRASPDYFNKRYLYKIKLHYGVTAAKYYQMLASQGGVCAICKEEPEPFGQKTLPGFHIDHCHATGEVRGLLCTYCNSTLGYSKDSVDRLINAAIYLENFQNHKL